MTQNKRPADPVLDRELFIAKRVDMRAFSSCFDNPIIQVHIKTGKVLKNRMKEVLGFEQFPETVRRVPVANNKTE